MARHELRDQLGRFMRNPTAEEMEGLGVFAADMEGFIMGSAAVREAKIVLAKEVRDYWKDLAPVRGDKDTHGQEGPTYDGGHLVGNPEDYRESIKVEEDAHGRVSVGSHLMPLAEWLEYGSEHNPEHGYGIRVLEHFGGSADLGDRVSDRLYIG